MMSFIEQDDPRDHVGANNVVLVHWLMESKHSQSENESRSRASIASLHYIPVEPSQLSHSLTMNDNSRSPSSPALGSQAPSATD